MRDLGHPVLARAENTDSWHARSGDLQCAFPLDIRTVPSSAINITADGECLTCVGFSFGETVRLGSFEFIADNFGGLSFSPRRGDLSVTFMGSTHSGTPSPRWAMIEDSIEEFLTVSSNEGGLQSPLSQDAPHGGSAYSHRNHTMDEDHSGHSSHDDGSTPDGCAVAGYRPPLRAMPHFVFFYFAALVR
jgi:hypothetical protein